MGVVLEVVYSLPFAAGMVVGILGQRLYCWLKARHEDRVHPLPNGQHRHIPSINRVYLAGLLVAAIVGYILVQVGQTEAHYKDLASSVSACQREFNEALTKRAAITAKNDELSIRQRALLAELDELQGVWLGRLINPPDDIADLDPSHPRRQQYGIDVSRVYFERANGLRAEVRAITAEQEGLAEQRSRNPLPEPRCGQAE